MAFRTIPADSRRHEDRPTQDGRNVEQRLFRIDSLLRSGPVEQRIQNHFPNDEPTVVALQVDLMRIPLAEQIVGPLIRGVNVIV